MGYSSCCIKADIFANYRMPSESGNESAGTEEDDDVIFHVGSETVMRIAAKRSVLSKKNDVFQAMFCGPYTQARENLRRCQASANSDSLPQQNHLASSPHHIYDPDVDGRAFKNLIRSVAHSEILFCSIISLILNSFSVFCTAKPWNFDPSRLPWKLYTLLKNICAMD